MASGKEYKDTLNLPVTEFPMRASLAQREPEFLADWDARDLYGEIRKARATGPRFVLHDGPPYANGHIHYGHILNKTLKDFVVKYRTMVGMSAPYVPGWDCHGLPIELQVERDLGPKMKQMSKPEVRRECEAYARRFVDIQRTEFKRLGVFGDWARPYLTMDHSYEAAITRAVGAFVRGGWLYRGKKPVHWDPVAVTALAEAEIEYHDHTSPSIYVRFPLEKFDGAKLAPALAGKALALVIWTTTPWTLPANLAVVMHNDFDYVAIPRSAGDVEHLIVARELAASFLKACRIDAPPETWVDIPKKALPTLVGARYRHPFVAPKTDADFRLWFAKHVTLEQGSGLVHTAPGHGAEDYQVGLEHELEIYAPVDDHGRFTADVPAWAGEKVFDANPKIIEFLRANGALLSPPDLSVRHSYPHSWRSKAPVLFRATPQWFISMEHADLRQRALDEIDLTRFIPPWGRNRIRGMIENRPDWCLSRQRAWGVPIPVVYCTACGKEHLDPVAIEHIATLFEKHGADIWFTSPPSELLPPGTKCADCGKGDFRKEEDIVDVWFESGVSWLAVCAGNPELGEPVDLYLEGSDQHRGWFHSSLLAAIGVAGHAPYKAVLTHGFVLDEHGIPYSKSTIEKAKREGKKVSYIPPEDVIAKNGAEILRMWAASTEFRSDIPYSQTILTQLSETYRKFRNTCRFLLGNLTDFDPNVHTPEKARLDALDEWALLRLGDFIARVRTAYDEYEFHNAFRRVNEYVTVELSAFYLDVLKDRLYCDGKDSAGRRAAQSVMYEIARALAELTAPIYCFTAEEVWRHLPRRDDDPWSVHLALMPRGIPLAEDDARKQTWDILMSYRELAQGQLEKFRAEKHHPLEARVTVAPRGADRAILEAHAGLLPDLFGVSQVDVAPTGATDSPTATVDKCPGERCDRCWKWYPQVTSGLCRRCDSVVHPPAS